MAAQSRTCKSLMKKSVVALTLITGGILTSATVCGKEPSIRQTPSITPAPSTCTLKGTPPSDYKFTIIKNLKLGKSSYGSVTDIQPEFAKMAREAGGDAIINYNGSQRFGFWPWRVVRPVITGTTIKWDISNAKTFACIENGGIFL